ncbi:MAG: tryptophan--tRNA ligase [Bacteroidota bacterium]
MNKKDTIILSGIQPSGKLHIGNYFGAIRQHIAMQDQGNAYYFIANYQSLTSLKNGAALKQFTYEVALDYLALGLEPEKATFFAQSDVPQVTELAWILGSLTPVSFMEKGVSYKDKVSAGLHPNIGLFTYPILQAADILIYHSNVVPVGEDQKQNIEICRDLASKFNHAYEGEFLVEPEEYIVKSVATVPGTDGQKMSKSYNNTLPIFDQPKDRKKKIMSILTDSTPLEEHKEEIAAKYRAGGYGYGHAKKELLGLMNDYFHEASERRIQLQENPSLVYDVLQEGGRRARIQAETVMQPIREITGIHRSFNSY